MVVFHREARHVAALAPGAPPAKVDLPKEAKAGRPGLHRETADLIPRLARENPRWGYQRIRGELAKLQVRVSATTIRTRPPSARPGSRPAPRRAYLEAVPTLPGIGHAGGRILHRGDGAAQDPLRAVLLIEPSTRRVYVTGATAHPDSAWVTQQARNLAIDGRLEGVRFPVHDRDAKLSGPFDEVFETEGAEVILTPDPGPQNERVRRAVRAHGPP